MRKRTYCKAVPHPFMSTFMEKIAPWKPMGMSCKEKARCNVWLYCIILFVLAEMKQQESLTIFPSPIISRKGGRLTALLNVHPSLSPLGFMRCGCFELHSPYCFDIEFICSLFILLLTNLQATSFLFWYSAKEQIKRLKPQNLLKRLIDLP